MNVRLLGLKNQEEVRALFKIADIFVLGSMSDANPLTSIEALWMKKPLILSENVGNYPEAVQLGLNGEVFSYSNREEAIRKINGILDQEPKWFSQAAEISYKKATSMFDIDKIAACTIIQTKAIL